MPTAANSFANRYGLNVVISKYGAETGESTITVDFANECALDLQGDTTWATGGQNAAKKVGFPNPYEGTFKISTQLMTEQLLALLSGADATGEVSSIVFKNDSEAATVYYVIEGETVWKTTGGATKTEAVKMHKALPKRAYNITYNGSGDPVSVDIEFDLMEDDDGNVATITYDGGAA